MEYIKTKSASKSVLPRGQALEGLVLDTMKTIATIVGGTLGPGGHPVLIERQEANIPPIITKDGVTVFRSLGFDDATQHCIMEAARDASVLTAASAGDGTTTATILSEALVRSTNLYCKGNKGVSPHQVIRTVHKTYKDVLLPELERLAIPSPLDDPDGREILKKVATISGNGDTELADAVMQCYDTCGDDGNVTIAESSGPRGYEVEVLDGYPLPIGYEDSCAKFYPAFINDTANQKVVLENPIFVLYFGRINDVQTFINLMDRINEAWNGGGGYLKTHNVCLVATGFSESVLGGLMTNWLHPTAINIFPLLLPPSPIPNGQRHMIDDLAAITYAKVFDPISSPLDGCVFEELGNLGMEEDEHGNQTDVWVPMGVSSLEVGRFRTTVIGRADDERVLERIDEVKASATAAESELDSLVIKERLAKLTGGIAKLRVIGGTNGDLKERRDRAEDAVCAVRGAIAHGSLVGGGWSLLRLHHLVSAMKNPVLDAVLLPALMAPVKTLLSNVGIISPEEQEKVIKKLYESAKKGDNQKAVVFNAQTGRFEGVFENGIFDSFPAVKESLENSISIASLLGTLGGTVVFKRDLTVERREARDAADFDRAIKSDFVDQKY